MNRGFDRLKKMPWFIRTLFSRMISRRMKKVHFGQVVPIEEIEQIFEFTNSITRVACVCRQSTLQKYGVTKIWKNMGSGLKGKIWGQA